MRPLRVFSGTAHVELAREICHHLDVELGETEIFKFKNDNTFVKIRENVRQQDVYVIQPSAAPVNEHFMELLLMMDALRRASAASVTVVMPYYFYCRSDKKDQPRIPITASLVAHLLEAAGADRVVTMDLHAEQIQGFFQLPVDQLLAMPVMIDYFRNKNDGPYVVVSPDAGGAKRARDFARELHCPLAIMDKRRLGNSDDAKVYTLVGDVEDKTAILVDDEISTGRSLVNAANGLKDHGAKKIIAAATHPVLCGEAPSLIEASDIQEVVVTNTLPVGPKQRFPKLTQLSVAQLFAKAIRRVQDGNSLSELFSL